MYCSLCSPLCQETPNVPLLNIEKHCMLLTWAQVAKMKKTDTPRNIPVTVMFKMGYQQFLGYMVPFSKHGK